MQIREINVLNNKINDIKYANVSKLHEYCNNYDRKSLIKIFYIIRKLQFLHTYKFVTKTIYIYKEQLQINRFTKQKHFLEKDYKTKAIKILR